MGYYDGYGNPRMNGNGPRMEMPYNDGNMGDPYQSRNSGYYQSTNQPPAIQPQAGNQITYIIRPVASIEEGKAIPTDFNGAITIMPDFSHGMIYTKALNCQNGTSIFNCYQMNNEFLNPKPVQQYPADYVPRSEFDALRNQFNALVIQLNNMTNTEGGNTNESENANAAGRRKSNAADAK